MISSALRSAGVLVVTVIAVGGSSHAQENTPPSHIIALEKKVESLKIISDRLSDVRTTLRGLLVDLPGEDGVIAGIMAPFSVEADLSLWWVTDLLTMSPWVSDQYTVEADEFVSWRLDFLIHNIEVDIGRIDSIRDDITSVTLSDTADRLKQLLEQVIEEFSKLKPVRNEVAH